MTHRDADETGPRPRWPAVLRIARRVWVPAFLVGCGIYVSLHADALVQSFVPPSPTHPAALGLALVLQAGVWIVLADAWRRVIHRRLGRAITFGAALSHFALFSFGKYLPGKVWGAAARAVDMGRQGVAASESVEATIYEQYLVLHSAALLSSALLPLLVDAAWSWLVAAVVIGTAPLAPVVVEHLLRSLASFLRRGPSPGTGSPAVTDTRDALALTARYIFGWGLHGAVLVAIFAALHGGPGALELRTVGLLVLGNTVGMVAGFAALFAPAGLGVREAAMAAVLATGMSVPEAVALSVAMRLWTVATDVVLGGATLLARRYF